MPRLAPVIRAIRVGVVMAAASRVCSATSRVARAGDRLSLAGVRTTADTSSMDRPGLADFLRRRREALRPDDVGLPAGRRRRTAGLRRKEVASLASMSTDFYARLEQQRGSRPSEEMVGAIARALRLSQDERDHLFLLAGHAAPTPRSRRDHVSPA